MSDELEGKIIIVVIRYIKRHCGFTFLLCLLIAFAIGSLAYLISLIAVSLIVFIEAIFCVLLTVLISNAKNSHLPLVSSIVTLVGCVLFDCLILSSFNDSQKTLIAFLGVALFTSAIGLAALSYFLSTTIVVSKLRKKLRTQNDQNIK